MIDKVSRFFNNYLLHPFSDELSALDKAICAIASGILFLISAGTVHLYFWVSRKVTHQTDSNNATDQVSKKVFNTNKKFMKNYRLPEKDFAYFGLNKSEYTDILTYYFNNQTTLATLKEPTHIRKDDDNRLPRSLVYVPNGPRKGLHILCKDKGIDEVGFGAFNKATLMLHVDTKKEEVGRSGKKEHVDSSELKANDAYHKIDPEGKYFVTGTVVQYSGPWSQRDGRRVGGEKIQGTQEKNVKKTMIIMDHIPGGELRDLVSTVPRKRHPGQTQKKNIQICLDIAKGLVIAHKANLVNLDTKDPNIFMSTVNKDGSKSGPKIGDFGMVHMAGEQLDRRKGTFGYMSPEVISIKYKNQPLTVCPANEMWNVGCIFAIVTKGLEFYRYTKQCSTRANPDPDVDYIVKLGKEEFEKGLRELFPKHAVKGSLDSILYGCLRYNPEDRLTVKKVVKALETLISKTPNKAHPSEQDWLNRGYLYA